MRITSIIVTALLTTTAIADAQEEQGLQTSEFRYDVDADQVIIDYSLYSGFPYYGKPAFGLKVYGDGRAIATLPKQFPKGVLRKRGYIVTRRGFFETRLSPQEIEEILHDVEPMFLIDTAVMKQQRNDQHPGRARTDGAPISRSISRIIDHQRERGRAP